MASIASRIKSRATIAKVQRILATYSAFEIATKVLLRIRRALLRAFFLPPRVVYLRLKYGKNAGRFIHLRELEPISEERWNAAKLIGSKIGELRDRRETIVRAKRIDSAIAFPGGDWSADGSIPIFKLFELVRKGDYQTINNLRLYSYMFSGFYLAHLANAQGVDGLNPPEIGDKLFSWLDRRAQKPPPFTVLEFCKMTRRIPTQFHVRPPKMLGEIGWEVNGSPANTDTRGTQGRINTFYETGVIGWLCNRLRQRGHLTLMEIGAGIGGVCYTLSNLFSPCRIIICDLPESLMFSATYLRLTKPDANHFVIGVDGDALPPKSSEATTEFIYVPNYLFGEIVSTKVDFAYNFGSFEEMSAQQVQQYGDGLCKMIEPDGLVLDLNEQYGCNSKQILENCFPHRKKCFLKTTMAKNNSIDLWSVRPLVEAQLEEPLKNLGYDWFWRLRQRAITAGLIGHVIFN